MSQVLAPDIVTEPAVNSFTGGFEGAEKKMEIEWKVDPAFPSATLRDIPQERWETILDLIHCKIVSSTKNEFLDSYVLSESSLFVYPYKVILKTCGTTTLLACMEALLQLAKEYHLEPDFFWYARKNFLYPEKQLFPHTSFDSEVDHLNKSFNGQAFVLGPRTGEHWHLYVCDMKDRDHVGEDQTLELIMTELDPQVMRIFYQDENFVSAKDNTKRSGIADLLPGAITDEVQFTPCGYSVNGLLGDAYFTIHITPEPHCSYVSFETNVSRESYTELITAVLAAFKPGKFTVTLFADAGALSGPSTFTAFDSKGLERLGYGLKYKSFSEFDGTYDLHLCHYHKFTPCAKVK